MNPYNESPPENADFSLPQFHYESSDDSNDVTNEDPDEEPGLPFSYDWESTNTEHTQTRRQPIFGGTIVIMMGRNRPQNTREREHSDESPVETARQRENNGQRRPEPNLMANLMTRLITDVIGRSQTQTPAENIPAVQSPVESSANTAHVVSPVEGRSAVRNGNHDTTNTNSVNMNDILRHYFPLMDAFQSQFESALQRSFNDFIVAKRYGKPSEVISRYPGDSIKGRRTPFTVEKKLHTELCCACFENVSDIRYDECGHIVYCVCCEKTALEKMNTHNCPICRKETTKSTYIRRVVCKKNKGADNQKEEKRPKIVRRKIKPSKQNENHTKRFKKEANNSIEK